MPEERQFVQYSFYRVESAWRKLAVEERVEGVSEAVALVKEATGRFTIRTFSILGIRADADVLFWKISSRLKDFQDFARDLGRTGLGRYLENTHAYLGMTRKSSYVKEHVHEGQEGRRAELMPGNYKYLFLYPFVKKREWYRLTFAARQGMMNEHIEVGHRFPSVKLNTVYSFGLDDQEFIVAFETDKPGDFLDLVMELRETEASMYTERDTPIFTCVAKDVSEALGDLV
ncbi:MAG: chlorite dismutase family protein [Thermoplasmata archaeon]